MKVTIKRFSANCQSQKVDHSQEVQTGLSAARQQRKKEMETSVARKHNKAWHCQLILSQTLQKREFSVEWAELLVD